MRGNRYRRPGKRLQQLGFLCILAGSGVAIYAVMTVRHPAAQLVQTWTIEGIDHAVMLVGGGLFLFCCGMGIYWLGRQKQKARRRI